MRHTLVSVCLVCPNGSFTTNTYKNNPHMSFHSFTKQPTPPQTCLSPGLAFADTSLVLRLLVVQLVVTGVSAAGGSGNHSPRLGVGQSGRGVVLRA